MTYDKYNGLAKKLIQFPHTILKHLNKIFAQSNIWTTLTFLFLKAASSPETSIFHYTFKQACFFVLLFSDCNSESMSWAGAGGYSPNWDIPGQGWRWASFPGRDGWPSIFDVLRLVQTHHSKLLPSQGILPVSLHKVFPLCTSIYACVLLLSSH